MHNHVWSLRILSLHSLCSNLMNLTTSLLVNYRLIPWEPYLFYNLISVLQMTSMTYNEWKEASYFHLSHKPRFRFLECGCSSLLKFVYDIWPSLLPRVSEDHGGNEVPCGTTPAAHAPSTFSFFVLGAVHRNLHRVALTSRSFRVDSPNLPSLAPSIWPRAQLPRKKGIISSQG